MATITVSVVAPDHQEFDAEIDDSADEGAVLASLLAGLRAAGVSLPDIADDGQQLRYGLQLESGLRVKPGARIHIVRNVNPAARITGRKS